MIKGNECEKETEVMTATSLNKFKMMGHIWKNKGHGQKAQIKQRK